MGGSSGGSSAPTEQTVYSESLPPYVEPYFRRLLGRAESESLQGYQPYRGQRLAYFSPDELGAQAKQYLNSGNTSKVTCSDWIKKLKKAIKNANG